MSIEITRFDHVTFQLYSREIGKKNRTNSTVRYLFQNQGPSVGLSDTSQENRRECHDVMKSSNNSKTKPFASFQHIIK